jgi:diguanylate cyclase (GGDEF)-like protein
MECESLSEHTIAKARILLAEDNPAQADVIKAFLVNDGHEVVLVERGAGLLAAVEAHKPDVILLDCMLSGMSGNQLCRRLKQNRNTSGIPIIMLTDKQSTSDKVAGLTSGADDCLPKPYDDDELSALICARLRTKSEWDNLKQKTRHLQEMLTRVETLANVDCLTGLFNRRRFETVFSTEFKKAVRYQLPLSCLMIDIDHFKRVNDTHGHAAGDEVIRDTVKIVQGSIRDVDTVARWGGEEFIIASPSTAKESAAIVGERIRKAVSSQAFQSAANGSVTVSIGIAGIPDQSICTMEQLIHAADLALYEAKKNGRNKVTVAP